AAAQNGTIAPVALPVFGDSTGAVCGACLIYTYAAGGTTNLATYTEVTNTTEHTNPIVLDASGKPPSPIFLIATSYRFDLKTSGGTLIDSMDNIAATPGTSAGLASTGDLSFQVDTDNDGTNIFTFLDGVGTEKAQINESGDSQFDGNMTIGDATEADKDITFDGNEQDFYVGLDDSDNDFVIGLGATVGTTPAISVDENQDVRLHNDLTVGGDFVAGSMLSVEAGATQRDLVTSVGLGLHYQADSWDINAAGNGETKAIGALVFLGIPTWTSTGTTLTVTDAATLYIQGQPVNSTNVTHASEYAIWVDAGAARFDDGLILAAGTGTEIYNSAGVIHVDTTQAATGANTDETTLASYSLPANTLSADNASIEIEAWGTVAANNNAKTIRLKFGSTTLTTGVLAQTGTDGGAWKIRGTVVRTGATAQKAIAGPRGVSANYGFSQPILLFTSPSETLANATTVLISGQNGVSSANDIVFEGLIIEYAPAP
ncbi:hypothetical protein LCGC14_1683010, partial [marine sediment metagenome]